MHVPKYLHIAANPLDPFSFSVFVRAIPVTDIQYTLSLPPASYSSILFMGCRESRVRVRPEYCGVGRGVSGEKVSSVADGEKMSVPYRINDLL